MSARQGPAHPGDLKPAPGATRRGRYLGRGRASGHGKTSGRGIKGQKSRTGYKQRPGFMGGNLPWILRLPKRGFLAPGKIRFELVSVGDLAEAFPSGGTIDAAALAKAGLADAPAKRVKILGDGEAASALHVTAHAFSASARKKIEAAGGSCTVLS